MCIRGMKWFAAAMVGALLLANSGNAFAGWRHHGSWGSSGSSGSWGSSGSSGSHGSWGSSGSSGSWGSSGSSGSSGSWGSSGSSGSSGGWGHHAVEPVYYHHTVITPAAGTVAAKPANQIAPARLVLNVPENATIYCMGKKTTTTGTSRRYVIPLAKAGQVFNYPIKMEVVHDGKTQVVEAVAKVQSGKTVELSVAEGETSETLALVQR